ncbi:MAG TPA: hypothetical protein LFW21_00155 [Rickettsia endosymbiont of Pyrocoelia pectoralis]|nr:hypothetical protein [Rickettsia endosymbiont of Pyrocoelia pectoralis]
MKYLMILLAALALTACANQKTDKSKAVIDADGDASYAIMRNIDDTNRTIGNNIARIPNPPIK